MAQHRNLSITCKDWEMEAETLALDINPSVNLLFVRTRRWRRRHWPYIIHRNLSITSSLYGLGDGRGDDSST
jgi:hypothetical protein